MQRILEDVYFDLLLTKNYLSGLDNTVNNLAFVK